MMKKTIAAFCFVALLAACAGDPPPPIAATNKPKLPKIALDVKTVSLADRSGSQTSSVFKANSFSPTIAEAIKQWAVDRLQAAGQTGNAIVIIKDASLVAQPIPVKKDDFFDNLFTRPQGMKYIGHAEVAIEASGRSGYAMANADATRVLTLPEEPTTLEKQEAYYAMLNGIMKDLGEHLDSGIKQHMSSMILDTSVNAAPLAPVSPSVSEASPLGVSSSQAVPPSAAPSGQISGQAVGSSLTAPPLLSGTNVK